MYDAIVLGARAAGAPAAALLARRGYRVLLADRAVFPSDTLSTLYIQQPGVARLARWGVLDEVLASGCPPLDHVIYELGDVRVEGCSTGVDGFRAAYAPRRYVLDAILADAAVAAGAEFRTGTELAGLLSDEHGRVTGVRLRTPGGKEFTEQAGLVVGADGMRSSVAAHAGARTLTEHPRMTCAYYTLWQGMSADFEMYEGPTGWVAAVPTSDAVLIGAYYPQSRFDEVRRDAQAYYLENVRTNAPALYERVSQAEQAERLYGTGDQQNFFRQAHGDGWVLIGDAGHHKDSLTARGISDAFMQAELLAECIGDGLSDPVRLEAALDEFAVRRDEALTESYQATLMVAQAEARNKRKMLLRALRDNPELIGRYFDTVAGILPVSALYTPELMAAMAPSPAAGG